MPPLTGTDFQRHALRLYGELVAREEVLAGKLIFTAGEGCSATGLLTGASIAGACTLALDPDAGTVKATFRRGGVDFVVNTLDEAVRVLKNELRKEKPLSVALIAPLQSTLDEMDERGVQPDLHMAPDAPTPSAQLTAWLAARSWTEASLSAPNLRALDAKLLALLPPDDIIRRRWIERIAHYQRPSPGGERVLWLTGAEREALAISSRDT